MSYKFFLRLLLAVVSLVSVLDCKPVGGKAETLVIASDASPYSRFLQSLRDRGHRLKIVEPKDASKPLVSYEELDYDLVIVLASTTPSFGGALKFGSLIDYVNAGGNVLIAASSDLSDALRDFSYEFSVDFDERGSAVFDYFNKADGDPLKVLSNVYSKASAEYVIGKTVQAGAPIVFSGVGHRLSGKNMLAFPVLTATSSAFSYDKSSSSLLTGDPLVGSSVVLVSAFQARNNARVVFSGSTDLFTDAFFDTQVTPFGGGGQAKAGNEAFVAELTKWAFREKSVIRISDPKHHRWNETAQHGIYRIKDELVYSATISEWTEDAWRPFQASDVQFEAVMLDPYVRKTMTGDKNGVFSAKFTLPDHYGVFTFKVNYNRHGLSYIHVSETVQIRPFRHDQYPRFLKVAYPYYANIFSMMAGFFLLSVLFLYNREPNSKGKAKVKTN